MNFLQCINVDRASADRFGAGADAIASCIHTHSGANQAMDIVLSGSFYDPTIEAFFFKHSDS